MSFTTIPPNVGAEARDIDSQLPTDRPTPRGIGQIPSAIFGGIFAADRVYQITRLVEEEGADWTDFFDFSHLAPPNILYGDNEGSIPVQTPPQVLPPFRPPPSVRLPPVRIWPPSDC